MFINLEADTRTNSAVYFVMSALFMSVCILIYIRLKRMPYTQRYERSTVLCFLYCSDTPTELSAILFNQKRFHRTKKITMKTQKVWVIRVEHLGSNKLCVCVLRELVHWLGFWLLLLVIFFFFSFFFFND